MATAARDWHPTVAVLVFTGDVFTACNGGVQVGTAQYYTKYREEIRTAISIFRSVGADVVLIGQPADSTARLTRNGSALNQLYRSIAKASRGRDLRRRGAGRHGEGAVHLDAALSLGPALHRTTRDEHRPRS